MIIHYASITEIYDAQDAIHAKLDSVLSGLTDEQRSALPDGEKWSIAQIVEHIALVEGGICRICAKLLGKAEAAGQMSVGLDLSEFAQKLEGKYDRKLEAPAMVQPVHGRSIAESLEAMEENRKAFRNLEPLFEKLDGHSHKFPHPYFGDLSAQEWLVLATGHKMRHVDQIRRLVEKIGPV